MKTNLITCILKQPHNLLLLAALGLSLFSFFTSGQSLDFNVHDTYIVISTIYFIWFLTFITLFIWTIYILTHKILWTKFLTWFHILTSLCVLLLILTSGYWINITLEPKREYATFQTFDNERQTQVLIIQIATITFIVGQIAFIANLAGGLIKKLFVRM